jgi:hypothetical protein
MPETKKIYRFRLYKLVDETVLDERDGQLALQVFTDSGHEIPSGHFEPDWKMVVKTETEEVED